EILDLNNPWFCPSCHRNQCAKQTMFIWRCPDTLIVHLKRFVYKDLASLKIDTEVAFPIEGLDLTHHVCNLQQLQLLYDLQSCICHTGGANAGHYTSYAKNVLNGKWYHYNDEMVLERAPSGLDFKKAYVLFYQRRGYSFIHSLIHSFTHSFIHSFIHSLIHSFISFFHSFMFLVVRMMAV
ncbi:hypothetical protein HELRODRAFT_91135, partial [Helobdella robusta]|uniref:ubiquitinyl hydrolase 1 n=1 Tax=Helobdella robusta TaxID=6412 RepID=T1G800_HELRO